MRGSCIDSRLQRQYLKENLNTFSPFDFIGLALHALREKVNLFYGVDGKGAVFIRITFRLDGNPGELLKSGEIAS